MNLKLAFCQMCDRHVVAVDIKQHVCPRCVGWMKQQYGDDILSFIDKLNNYINQIEREKAAKQGVSDELG